ncbi:hypothetical protein ACS32F_000806 [Vibrio cholerae]|nr:hypothetical protein [Vibrio cholerae]EGR0538097.1 hypothetical protein [Vibrio cholerae]EJL6448622.1 hypothetical protein [Vibrio cholerae]NOE30449.1 hypothetical protein [Vibrio cholerae]HCJ6778538.1 hypothetical protein [Vibrio cholerae]
MDNRYTESGLLPFISYIKEQIAKDNHLNRDVHLTLLATLIKVEKSLSVNEIEKAKRELLLGFGLTVPPKQKRNTHSDEDIWMLVMYYKKHHQHDEDYVNPSNFDCPKLFGELANNLNVVRNTLENRFNSFNSEMSKCYNKPILNDEYLINHLIDKKEYLEEVFQMNLPQLKK